MFEVTQKAFKNREPIKGQKDKKLTRVIVAALAENLNNETVWHNRPEGDQETSKLPSEKDLCVYCKEKGHWKDECTMEENGPVSTKVRKGTGPSLLHFKPPRVTLKVRGKKMMDFLVGTGATYSVFVNPIDQLTDKGLQS